MVKDAVTSYGASVVPFGDSALIEVPLPSGETPGLFIVLNTNRKHHRRLAECSAIVSHRIPNPKASTLLKQRPCLLSPHSFAKSCV